MKKLILALALCGLSTIIHAAKIIELNHQTAESIIPLLEPLLEPGAKLHGHGKRLLVQTSASNFEKLHNLVIKLDVMPANLVVTVRQGFEQGLFTDSFAYQYMDVYSNQAWENGQNQQQVRVLSGQRALVEINKQIPVVTALSFQEDSNNQSGSLEQKFTNLRTGIIVTPRLVGSRLILTIERILEGMDGYNQAKSNKQLASTTIIAELGEWVNVGNTSQLSDLHKHSFTYMITERYKSYSDVYVKVDEFMVAK